MPQLLDANFVMPSVIDGGRTSMYLTSEIKDYISQHPVGTMFSEAVPEKAKCSAKVAAQKVQWYVKRDMPGCMVTIAADDVKKLMFFKITATTYVAPTETEE